MLFVALISPAVPLPAVPAPKLLTCAFELVEKPPDGPVGPVSYTHLTLPTKRIV